MALDKPLAPDGAQPEGWPLLFRHLCFANEGGIGTTLWVLFFYFFFSLPAPSIKKQVCCRTVKSAGALLKGSFLWCNFQKCLVSLKQPQQLSKKRKKKKTTCKNLSLVFQSQLDCRSLLAKWMNTTAPRRKTCPSVSRYGCRLGCVVLHCRQAPYLWKQHVSFACRPSSTQAPTINLIQLCCDLIL